MQLFGTIKIYIHVGIRKEKQPKMALTIPGMGEYQFTQCSFGLCNAPGQFQALLVKVTGGLDRLQCAFR